MAVFAVIAPEFDTRLKEAVEAKFPGDSHYDIAPGQYLVATRSLTSQQVSKLLEAPGGGIGRVLILRVTNHAGWHARDIWEWISTHLNPPPASDIEAADGQ